MQVPAYVNYFNLREEARQPMTPIFTADTRSPSRLNSTILSEGQREAPDFDSGMPAFRNSKSRSRSRTRDRVQRQVWRDTFMSGRSGGARGGGKATTREWRQEGWHT